MHVKIYHNPRCSKSREALALLEKNGVKPQVVEYLENPPSRKEIKDLLEMLGVPVRQLLRSKEPEFAAMGLENAKLTENALVKVLAENPRLMERPVVVVDGAKAVIARPPEKLLDILRAKDK